MTFRMFYVTRVSRYYGLNFSGYAVCQNSNLSSNVRFLYPQNLIFIRNRLKLAFTNKHLQFSKLAFTIYKRLKSSEMPSRFVAKLTQTSWLEIKLFCYKDCVQCGPVGLVYKFWCACSGNCITLQYCNADKILPNSRVTKQRNRSKI